MAGYEPHIFCTATALLLAMHALRFLLQELISVVILYKRLKNTIRAEPRQRKRLPSAKRKACRIAQANRRDVRLPRVR